MSTETDATYCARFCPNKLGWNAERRKACRESPSSCVPFKERETERGKEVRLLMLEKRVDDLETALRELCDVAMGIDDRRSDDDGQVDSWQSQYWSNAIKSAKSVLGKTP